MGDQLLAAVSTFAAGSSKPPPHIVEVGRQEVRAGGTGVLVRVDGQQPLRRSTVRSTEGEPKLTGRGGEMRSIEGAFRDRRVVVLHGAPGLGKSRLAREYAHRHVNAYPGGMFFVPFEQPPPTELAKLLRDTGHPPHADESVEDQCRRMLRGLGTEGRTLLIYDAVSDERTLRDWLPYDGLDWHVLVTSTSANWSSSWKAIEVGALGEQEAHALVATILGDDAVSARLAEPITTKAAGVTIELCASATAAYERLRRGRPVESVSAELARETTSSFEAAWTLLSRNAQVALRVACAFATSRVPERLVVSTLRRVDWSATAVESAIDDARDRRLAAGAGNSVEVHELVTRFVREREPLGESIRRSLFQGLITTATAFVENPGNLDVRALIQAHFIGVDGWADLISDWLQWTLLGQASMELGRFEAALGWYEHAVAEAEKDNVQGRVDSQSLGTSLHQVGCCYSSLGRFEEAMRWYERAVAVAEKSEVDGWLDSQSLGTSLHQVGDCYSRLGKFEAALAWFERAVGAAEKGDAHGRVDSQSLGTSLHQVGYCYSSLGKFEAALPWFERAVSASERGDTHGRVDSGRVGTSLHQVGYCCSRLGKFEAALPWFERAVTAAEKGDVHGRVDSQSLGTSLHRVGDCYSRLGKFDAALPWFERAVAAAEKGDVHGRVDFQSVGASLAQVGDCYSRLGQFDAALRWFERAVAAAEKGNVHGRVDSQSLGRSLHHVGYCYSSLGKFEAALPWYERAVAAAGKGDMHGRLDNESLGTSLHQVGYCYSSLGNFEVALSWFERAVAAAEKGDVHSRVDSQSRGTSLAQMGYCYFSLGKFDAALPWFERAVAAKEKGNVHGQVDSESLETSLHQVGQCYEQLGKFEEAQRWHERAVRVLGGS